MRREVSSCRIGRKQPWGEIALETSAIVSSIPIDDWKPTSKEFEGYTGNEGNTLDRWYHRSAIVLWHREGGPNSIGPPYPYSKP
jgi:hypothetical protein